MSLDLADDALSLPGEAPERPRPADRVSYVRALMLAGQWVVGETAAQLAAQWGLAQNTVEHDAVEASRSIQLALADKGQALAMVYGMLLKAGEDAAAEPSPAKRAGVRLKAAALLAQVTGCAAPARVAVVEGARAAEEFAWESVPAEEPKV